eukprot:GDKJ01003914.1.p1 GENE.GDKJ01003914.1~~GDKJ01003914.1.p1  ORF type:complete len:108 (+),score=4.62 GDKJ01003914.1:15-338(+)
MFYQLLYGKRPFGEGVSQKQIWQSKMITNARAVVFPTTADPKVSDMAKEVIQLCLKYNSNERPDVIALSKHAYFKQKGRGGTSNKMLPPASPTLSTSVSTLQTGANE